MSITHAYQVSGMTCGHCVGAVTEEIRKLATVESVEIDLNPEALSIVTVISAAPVAAAEIATALDEDGDYALVTA